MKKLIISKLIVLFFFLACSENTDKADSTDLLTIRVDLHDNHPVDFYKPINMQAEGMLTLSDSLGETTNYNIFSGDNTLEIPHGNYAGIVHSFSGFTNDSISLTSPGDSSIFKAAIGRIPDFNYRIKGHNLENTWYYLHTQCDTNQGYYTFSVWGSNDDTLTMNGMDKVASFHRAIDTNGSVRLLVADLNLNQTPYKFYNLSLAPLYGFMPDTVLTSWYALINQ